MEGPIAGQSIPVLFLQDGQMSLYSLTWARKMMLEDNSSPMHLFKCVKAVGLLYDFYVGSYEERPLAQNEMIGLMKVFFEARAYGNRALGWKPVGRKNAKKDVRYASEFSKFCSANFGTYQINPTEKKLLNDLNISDQLQYYANLNQRKHWNLLDHLTQTTELGQGIISGFSFTPKSENTTTKYAYKYFPPEKALEFIASTKNLRDKLAFILMFFGGLRESELLHLYITDITTPNGEAKIRIGHPELSAYSWNDPFRGKQNGNRLQFLADRYGLAPRHKLGLKNPFHAGWKGMKYTEIEYEANFTWLLPEIGRLFAKLHRRYLHEYRIGIPDSNPYYFVSFQGEQFGSPLKISNLTKSFCRTARKIGLTPYEPGVSPHGCRHFYGHFCASYLKIPIERTQLMLRHAKISSTQIYYSIDERIVRDELIKAYEKMKTDIPSFIRDVEHLTDKEH
jgi:integrase